MNAEVLPGEVERDQGLEGPDPEVVEEEDDGVEAGDVVGHEVDHLADGGAAEGALAQPEGLEWK